jgi:hypothetical protein
MINLLAACIGILAPAAAGLLAVNLIDRGMPVLGRLERAAWALILGPTLSMMAAFLLTAAGITRFTLSGFLIAVLGLIAVLAFFCMRRQCLLPADLRTEASDTPLHPWMKAVIVLFALWAGLKLIAGGYDLIGVPTYWDDSFNNWNMRGKIFYETQQVTLEIPVGNGTIQTAQGVSSYPPSLPLMKTWVSVLRGSWQESLVNGIQLTWIAGLLLAFFGTLRRFLGTYPSLFGTALLMSLPHLLIQAANPYAEIFLASHLFLSVTALVHAGATDEWQARRSWILLFALSLGLLLFTKNEATILYAPLLIASGAYVLRRGLLQDRRTLLQAMLLLAVLALPWIIFKWMNGLTFGNAKSVSGVDVRFSSTALNAVWHHLTHEPNLLFLPLALAAALAAAGRRALRKRSAVLTVFVIGAAALQILLFTFVGALETEAVMQTGLSRGFTQLAPVAMLLLILLSADLLRE